MKPRPPIFAGLVVAAALYLALPRPLEARGIVTQAPHPGTVPGKDTWLQNTNNPPPAQQGQTPTPFPGPVPPPLPGHPNGESSGQNGSNAPAPAFGDQAQLPTLLNRATHLIGLTVKNPQNQVLGKIRDLIIDFKTSRVPYLVLEKAGRTHGDGTGSELAIPLNHFSPSPDKKSLLLNADLSLVESAAGFSGDNFPAMNNPAFGAAPEPMRREILIIPVPVNPDQNPQDQHDAIPPSPKHGPKIENP
jgi:sporulation protein YlmC with PRC-barrel domain